MNTIKLHLLRTVFAGVGGGVEEEVDLDSAAKEVDELRNSFRKGIFWVRRIQYALLIVLIYEN